MTQSPNPPPPTTGTPTSSSSLTPATAATGGTLIGATIGLVIWILSSYVFHGAVPGPVETFVDIGLPAGATGISTWFLHRQVSKSK